MNSNLNKKISINRINVNVLKNRLFEKKRKEKFQTRVILGSLIFSVGIISYLSS